ncbi:hypothetical protein G7054_g187 [Neopestalotiopsis clavispora]|nr:hypothetical protein G7054_g187 [Neopestalotiopsis clavispora]
MSFYSRQDEPRPSRQGRRLQRRGSSSSSGRRETSSSDDDWWPSRTNHMDDRVESWRESDTSYHIRVRRVTSLPPDPRRPRALPEFQYYPLEEGRIRILRLLAGNKEDKVRCELFHMSLERPRPYTAMSYAWGDTYDKVDIELNRGFFKVTKSLYGALEAVRESDRHLLVWADAVQKMYRIYQKADLVGIWLGPEADDSARAISLIKKFTEEGASREELRHMIFSRSWEQHFHALVDLFERDYWNRLWVVQEVYYAKQAMVYCGDHRTSWGRFIRIPDVLHTFKDDLQERFQYATRLQRRDYWLHLVENGPACLKFRSLALLEEYLGYYRRSLTSDPRDKLYGLLGILPNHIWERFQPDYESSPEKLYIDIVEYSLETPSLLKLPSWVPDWSQTTTFSPLWRPTKSWNGSRFRASGSFGQEAQLLGDARRKLKMKAIYIGSVTTLGVPLPEILNQHTTVLALIDWWYIFKRLPGKYNESFCRTITLDETICPGWTPLCCHIVGMIARYELPSFPSHPDLRANPSIRINRQEAETIFDKKLMDRLSEQRFFVIDNNDLGLARGTFELRDVVCIPLGVLSQGIRASGIVVEEGPRLRKKRTMFNG